MPDPDLEIRGGGGVQSSRPLEKGGPGLQKNFFFGPGLKIRKGGGGQRPQAPPLNLPLQQQVYSVLPVLYNNMVLPTEIQIINR